MDPSIIVIYDVATMCPILLYSSSSSSSIWTLVERLISYIYIAASYGLFLPAFDIVTTFCQNYRKSCALFINLINILK